MAGNPIKGLLIQWFVQSVNTYDVTNYMTLFLPPTTKLREGNVSSHSCLITGGPSATTTHDAIVQAHITWGLSPSPPDPISPLVPSPDKQGYSLLAATIPSDMFKVIRFVARTLDQWAVDVRLN